MAYSFVPSNADTLSVQIGIDHLLEGYIIQSEDITEQSQNLVIADQKGRTAQVIAYDKVYNCNITCIGPKNSAPFGGAATSATWYKPYGTEQLSYVVDSVQMQATYNDTAKYSVAMTGYLHANVQNKTDDAL